MLKTRHPLIMRFIGALLMLGGGALLIIAPLESYTIYWFQPGGRFGYEGFKFGSFMFAFIVWQIIAYYALGALLLILGYGHLRLRRWTGTLAVALAWCWVVLGIPLSIIVEAVLVGTKEASALIVIGSAALLAIAYLALPWWLIRSYGRGWAHAALAKADPQPTAIEGKPMPVLVLSLLCLFYGVMLHVSLFFDGLVPIWGQWISGLPGATAIAWLALLGGALLWALWNQRRWAWWGMLAYGLTLTSSLVFTLARSSYLDLLALLNLPPTEVAFLDGLPLQGIHLAGFVGLPLLASWGILLWNRRHWDKRGL